MRRSAQSRLEKFSTRPFIFDPRVTFAPSNRCPMPKLIDYPRTSLNTAIEISDATYAMGGSCTAATCAAKLGKQMSGAFRAAIGSAVKFGLVTSKGGKLAVTDRYKAIKLAYNDEERRSQVVAAFLTPGLYATIAGRFAGIELPTAILDKVLMKEMGVDPKSAAEIAQRFIGGVKSLGLLENGVLVTGSQAQASGDDMENGATDEAVRASKEAEGEVIGTETSVGAMDGTEFIVHITGPGMNSKLILREEEDMEIVNAMLKKVQRRLSSELTPSS